MLGSQCMSPHFEMHKFPYFDTFLSINGIQSCKHSNDEVCYFPMNLIQYYYFSQYVFHDLVCLVGMFLFEDVSHEWWAPHSTCCEKRITWRNNYFNHSIISNSIFIPHASCICSRNIEVTWMVALTIWFHLACVFGKVV